MKLADIHQVLGEIRKEKNISQKSIADALNVEQAAVSMYENGKRGIPLDILDVWLQLLDIEIRFVQKDGESMKEPEEIESDLNKFGELKIRRNFLIAELRAIMAEAIAQEPEFQKTNLDTEELKFWPYSFCADPFVGVVETRYDHPEQKYLAVEYAESEVNVYKNLRNTMMNDAAQLSRTYFTEDDFLTAGGQGRIEEMDSRKITLLQKNSSHAEGYELIQTEGFSLSTLLEMQEIHRRLSKVCDTVRNSWLYTKMDKELQDIEDTLAEILFGNRVQQGRALSEFVMWTDGDLSAIDVPLYGETRTWRWVEEGVIWTEDLQEEQEIQVLDNSIDHEMFYTHRDEEGNRIIGLVGPELKPALFKSNPNRPNVMYRVETDLEELNEEERNSYNSVLASRDVLSRLSDDALYEETQKTGEADIN